MHALLQGCRCVEIDCWDNSKTVVLWVCPGSCDLVNCHTCIVVCE